MKTNNYNTNANGPSIETTAFYDSFLGADNWRENFERTKHDGYFYTAHGQIKLDCMTDKDDMREIYITGYSKGDYAWVYVNFTALEKLWGKKPEETDLKSMFENIFYDVPIYAQVTVNGEEYNYWDCPDYDEHDWKRDEFIAWLSEQTGIDASEFEAVLPLNLDYS
jgi:hypothetical protein